MIGKMSVNNMNRISSKNVTTITHNINILFEIGTSHMYLIDTNETLLEDVRAGVETHAQNNTNKTVNKDLKDGVEVST